MSDAAPAIAGTAIGLAALLLAAARRGRIDIEGRDGTLVVRPRGMEAVFALCRELRIPTTQVQSVAAASRHSVSATGLRLGGTGFPGLIRAGRYGTGATRDFWLVHRAQQVLVIDLAPGAAYRRIVLEVPDPDAEALRLRPLVGTGTPSGR